MQHYVGLDVSMEATAVCVIDERGAVVATATVASDPAVIAGYVRPWMATLAKVGLEAGGLTPWLWTELRARGVPAICIETRRLKAYAKASAVKTDRRDAELIARAMRAGLYRAVHVKSEDSHKVRLALSGRQALLRQARQLQVKVRGDLKPFGIRVGKVGRGGFAARVEAVLHGRADLLALITPLLKMRAALLTQVRGYDQRLRQQAAADAVCRRLMSTPGVGPLTALAFRSGIDQLGRFRRAADVPAALGLTPRIDQSGERERIGAITKAGDRLVRTLLFEAANALLTRTKQWSALKRWGLKVAQRRGMNRARVAVARRLAIVLFAIWRDGTAFRARTAATAA